MIMPDTTFANSYVLTDAILEAYLVNDPRAEAVALKAAAAAAQGWYCAKATKNIDALPLRGRKYVRDASQGRQFPREYMTDTGWYPDCDESGAVDVPDAVISACCEEAIVIYGIYSSPDRLERHRLQKEGVVSVSYSGTSEQYSSSPSGAISGAANRFSGLMSKEAFDLLKKYISRSLPIV
jgi:hypothetical protein